MIQIAVSTQLWGEELLSESQFRLLFESGFRVLELFAAPGHFEWQDESYVKRIAGIAEYCVAHEMYIALENPPPYELGGDNNDLLELYRYFVDEPSIQSCFDTGHAQL